MVQRFTFLIGEPVEDDQGVWIRYEDVEVLFRVATEQAERHDRFLAALSLIARLPRRPFSGWDAISTARKALGR